MNSDEKGTNAKPVGQNCILSAEPEGTGVASADRMQFCPTQTQCNSDCTVYSHSLYSVPYTVLYSVQCLTESDRSDLPDKSEFQTVAP